MPSRILVVDDEENIVRLVSYNLQQAGFEVRTAFNGLEADESMRRLQPELVVLDMMLPEIDGLTLLKKWRKEGIRVPVIMLTARGEEIDRVLSLELGCDDYVTKPFSPRELVARINAVLRRTQDGGLVESSQLVVGNLVIDLDRHEAALAGNVLNLTRKEFELLVFLAKNRGRVITREVLLDRVWDYAYEGDTRVVDVHISHLREKVEQDPRRPELIKTVRGIGYKMV